MSRPRPTVTVTNPPEPTTMSPLPDPGAVNLRHLPITKPLGKGPR